MSSEPNVSDALKGIVSQSESDDDLNAKMADARRFELDLRREDNSHTQSMRDKDLGFVGRFIGGEKTAGVSICFVVIATCLLICAASVLAAWHAPGKEDFWYKVLERSFSVASAFAAFIFGKNSK